MGLEGEQFLRNTRSRRLPALWVGGEDCRERSKEWSRGRKAAECVGESVLVYGVPETQVSF